MRAPPENRTGVGSSGVLLAAEEEPSLDTDNGRNIDVANDVLLVAPTNTGAPGSGLDLVVDPGSVSQDGSYGETRSDELSGELGRFTKSRGKIVCAGRNKRDCAIGQGPRSPERREADTGSDPAGDLDRRCHRVGGGGRELAAREGVLDQPQKIAESGHVASNFGLSGGASRPAE